MAVGKVPSSQLQSWSGTAWSQTAIGSGAVHALPPLRHQQAREEATDGPLRPSTSKGSNAVASGSQAAPVPGNGTGNASAQAAPAANGAVKGEMTSFVAQAMLTAHYSINSAFLLDEPILQVTSRL